eukprot:355458-Rhodomonas_salina.1
MPPIGAAAGGKVGYGGGQAMLHKSISNKGSKSVKPHKLTKADLENQVRLRAALGLSALACPLSLAFSLARSL